MGYVPMFILVVVLIVGVISAGFRWYLATFDEEGFRELMVWRYPNQSDFDYEYLRRTSRILFPAMCVIILIMLISIMVTQHR